MISQITKSVKQIIVYKFTYFLDPCNKVIEFVWKSQSSFLNNV